MTNDRIEDYTEDQLFSMEGHDEDGAQEYLSDIAVKLMEEDYD